MDVFVEVNIGKDKFSKGQLKTQKEICRVKGNIRYYICDEGNVHEIVSQILELRRMNVSFKGITIEDIKNLS